MDEERGIGVGRGEQSRTEQSYSGNLMGISKHKAGLLTRRMRSQTEFDVEGQTLVQSHFAFSDRFGSSSHHNSHSGVIFEN